MRKSAIVTILLGNKYQEYWNRWCRSNWQAYAARHQFDLVLLKQPLDTSSLGASRSASWQKLLILNQEFSRHYERIVWLDADIVVNPQAPSIVEATPADKVGGVISGSYILDDLKPIMLERMRGSCPAGPARTVWEADQRALYARHGLPDSLSEIVQGGVLVLNPELHAPVLQRVYHTPHPEGRTYEQMPLSYSLLRENLFQPVDSRFNMVFVERMLVQYPYLAEKKPADYDRLARLAVKAELANSYFLHFAYDPQLARFTSPDPGDWSESVASTNPST